MSNYEDAINSMWEEVEGRKDRKSREEIEQEEWEAFKNEFYGSNFKVQSKWGNIDFSPTVLEEIQGGEKITYDEYLEIMRRTGNQVRHYFEYCYHDCIEMDFKGQIEKMTTTKICFQRIYVCGTYCDGTCMDGKEDHVWMDLKGFEKYEVGDSVSFSADVYMYLKTGNGKAIDYGLRNPDFIKKIPTYSLPTDDDLTLQAIDQIICETCLFAEHCYMGMCIVDENWRNEMRAQFFEMATGRKLND